MKIVSIYMFNKRTFIFTHKATKIPQLPELLSLSFDGDFLFLSWSYYAKYGSLGRMSVWFLKDS